MLSGQSVGPLAAIVDTGADCIPDPAGDSFHYPSAFDKLKGLRKVKHVMIPYRQEDHGDFDAEWSPHKKVSGWWYITGTLTDQLAPELLYSYQFTFIRPRIYGITPYLLQLALTDFQTGKHWFTQKVNARHGNIFANQSVVNYASFGRLEQQKEAMTLTAKADEFELELELSKGKGAFWHGDNGVLVMGSPEDPRQRTVYYSYTNMPTTGQVTWNEPSGKKSVLKVSGQSWFDRQWGPYRVIHPGSHWEWFSLRFSDAEEVMLFAFPQHPYLDGTYVDQAGNGRRVRDYTYTPKEYIEVNGFTFSKGWDLTLPGIKEERYEIRPLMEGQLNLAYFELLAEIIDPHGKRAGFCFVELLPGARNPDMRIDFRNLLRRV